MHTISLSTTEHVCFIDITRRVQQAVTQLGIKNGSILVFCPHTTAAITINENADPDVQRDMLHEINKIVPFEDGYHHFEGNSAAHIKASLFGASNMVIIKDGHLQLGRWQGLYFCEFDGPRNREVWLSPHS